VIKRNIKEDSGPRIL